MILFERVLYVANETYLLMEVVIVIKEVVRFRPQLPLHMLAAL